MPANKIKVDNAVLKRYARQSARRRQRVVSLRILIVCEGERTEPRYFDSFKKKHNGLFVLDMDVLGLGANTLSVVNKAIELKTKAESVGIPYDSVWAIFDRDSFSEAKFNAAVQKAESNGVNAAWSNEAFELWYLYHFHNRVTAMSRDEYKKAISDAVNSSPAYKLKRKYQYPGRFYRHCLVPIAAAGFGRTAGPEHFQLIHLKKQISLSGRQILDHLHFSLQQQI